MRTEKCTFQKSEAELRARPIGRQCRIPALAMWFRTARSVQQNCSNNPDRLCANAR
jgi:hypothetical protein